MWELCVPCLQDTLIAVNGESSIGLGFDKAFAMIAGAGPRVFPSLPRSVLPFGIQKVVGSRGLTTRVGRGDREPGGRDGPDVRSGWRACGGGPQGAWEAEHG